MNNGTPILTDRYAEVAFVAILASSEGQTIL